MKSMITIMKNGTITDDKITYTLDCKSALIAYIEQYINNNYNTWQYPKHIEGIRTITDSKGNRAYYDYRDKDLNDYVIGSKEFY